MFQDGFIKAAAATPHLRVADPHWNTDQILALADRAAAQGVQVLCFPELCVTGYTCSDLFLQDLLLENALEELRRMVRHSQGIKMLTVVGLPLRLDNRLFNCAAVLSDGRLLGLVPKTYIPNYGEFYERRHFSPASAAVSRTFMLDDQEIPFGTDLLFRCRENAEFQVAAEICEDLWVPVSPGALHALAGASLIVNPSASNETVGKASYRRELVKAQSAKCVCAYVYASAGEGESSTDLVFAGQNLIAENGVLLAENPPFAGEGDGLLVSHIDVMKLLGERRRMTSFLAQLEGAENQLMPRRHISFSLAPEESALQYPVEPLPFVPQNSAHLYERCEEIFAIQVAGLTQRMRHIHASHAVVNISGGLDSTLALLVTARAFDALGLPREGITALTLPGFGTTDRTYHNALSLMRLLGCTIREISIVPAVRQHFSDIGQDADNHDVTYENSQARERTQIAMDIANQLGCPVIGTGDLSELALGWATYNGDHMSMYGVNAGVPKTLVRHLVRHVAEHMGGEVKDVLLDIVATPVSPELLPHKNGEIQQKTEDIVGPYELHDFYLYQMVRFGFPPRKVYRLAQVAFAGSYDDAVILKWLKVFVRRFFAQQYKRSCLPDGPKVGSVSLSPRGDWRMPSDATARAWLDDLEGLG
ncbi:MAG: NAD(+) synthase [Eubacteriales bacterium]|nr:NAD(+) synthase [Eubacteriales bacterium]